MDERSERITFALTHRQKRLRSVTVVILLFIVVMLGFSLIHPFFHPARPPVMTQAARKALAAQGMMILGYYAVIFTLALALVVIAWLYVREIRVQLAIARRDMWQKIVDDQSEARRRRSVRLEGNGSSGTGRDGEKP